MGTLQDLASQVTPERAAELQENLVDVKRRIRQAAVSRSNLTESADVTSRDGEGAEVVPLLVAVSKYKPASDIFALYQLGHRDFGENYVQELVEKAHELPDDIRWHFIGTLQSKKAKILASIPNVYAIQTIGSVKAADAVNKALPEDRKTSPLNVLLQVNTSGEGSKSGLPPLVPAPGSEDEIAKSELYILSRHIVERCTRLHLQGLMTIGSLSESLSESDENRDFATLSLTRDVLERRLHADLGASESLSWGDTAGANKAGGGKLVLSMGMSSDFEAAVMAGSDIVRVGMGIFGERPKKEVGLSTS